ncbi:MAG: hypothetical protein VKJ24_02085 [Synechococcales bacterium]|nr:hypothetical protein [Synechococcales bacterium]
MSAQQKSRSRKTRNFSSFDLTSAMKQLGIQEIHAWKLTTVSILGALQFIFEMCEQNLLKLN